MDPNDMFFYNDNSNKEQPVTEKKEETKYEDINIEPVKEKKPKKKKNKFLIILFVLVLIGGFGVSGYILVDEMFLKNNKEEKKEEKKEEPPEIPEPIDDNVERDLTDQAEIDRLSKFVLAASYNDKDNKGIMNYFVLGVKDLTPEAKVVIAYNSVFKVNHRQTPIASIPAKYERNVSMSYLEEFPIDAFYEEYRTMFNEELAYDVYALNSVWCPKFYTIDPEVNRMYIAKDCQDPSGKKYESKIYKLTGDKDYYYVYQHAIEVVGSKYKIISTGQLSNVNSFEGNESKFDTIVWLFDKNFNFVRTRNLGVVSLVKH